MAGSMGGGKGRGSKGGKSSSRKVAKLNKKVGATGSGRAVRSVKHTGTRSKASKRDF